MRKLPLKVAKSLEKRKQEKAFRTLRDRSGLVDFSSNDYLGFASSEEIFRETQEILLKNSILENGASGSRLLSGNHELYGRVEKFLSQFHGSEAALIFNSGYDANIGIFSSIPKRGDFIIYDELVHASIRDGISMSHAKAFKFKHNDLEDLKKVVKKTVSAKSSAEVFLVTEAVFSMDGDSPDLNEMVSFVEEEGLFLIVDEAHSIGVDGENGRGLVQKMAFENRVFARVVTFGKAIGVHGAAVLGSKELKDYLINFARSLIYTTALPPHTLATVLTAYRHLERTRKVEKLRKIILFFTAAVEKQGLQDLFIPSESAIHCCVIPGNERVREISKVLEKEGFDVKAILPPTVPAGKERLRFCLHSYNSEAEIKQLLKSLKTFINE